MADQLQQEAFKLERQQLDGVVILTGAEMIDELDRLFPVASVQHYTVLLDALIAEGMRPSGVDPKATLLTNLSRSFSWEPHPPRSGLYRRAL